MKLIVLMLGLSIVSSSSVSAAIYKCDVGGIITYKSTPCANKKSLDIDVLEKPIPVDDKSKTKSKSAKTKSSPSLIKKCNRDFNTCISKLKTEHYSNGLLVCEAEFSYCKVDDKSSKNSQAMASNISLLKRGTNFLNSLNDKEKLVKKREARLEEMQKPHNDYFNDRADEEYLKCRKDYLDMSRFEATDRTNGRRVQLENNVDAKCANVKAEYLAKWR